MGPQHKPKNLLDFTSQAELQRSTRENNCLLINLLSFVTVLPGSDYGVDAHRALEPHTNERYAGVT